MCGEQCWITAQSGSGKGSPPRVRGTVLHAVQACGCLRITPACAGNRICRCYYRKQLKDHPRVCGEQWPQRRWTWPAVGSPPRVRGTGTAPWMFLKTTRITPACAGNSSLNLPQLETLQDHPRVCGEQARPLKEIDKKQGSPPRVRGTASI